MSQRTIIELNHDLGYKIRENPQEFVDLLGRVLNSGVNCNPENERGVKLEQELRRFGVTVTPTHHHSDKATVTLGTKHGGTYYEHSL